MTPEEFNRIKEEEKAHLRKLKALKQTARQLERKNRIVRAVTDMATSGRSALDENADLVDGLMRETAHEEARLELALEATAEHATPQSGVPNEAEAEEALLAARAKALLSQMKQQLGVPAAEGRAAPARQTASEPAAAPPADKTLGPARTKPEQTTASQAEAPDASKPADDPSTASSPPAARDLPEKTIGRIRR